MGATDGKWMRQLWGEPSAHSTAAELYEDMLNADLDRMDAERMDRLFADWGEDPEPDVATPEPLTEPKRKGFFARLFGR